MCAWSSIFFNNRANPGMKQIVLREIIQVFQQYTMSALVSFKDSSLTWRNKRHIRSCSLIVWVTVVLKRTSLGSGDWRAGNRNESNHHQSKLKCCCQSSVMSPVRVVSYWLEDSSGVSRSRLVSFDMSVKWGRSVRFASCIYVVNTVLVWIVPVVWHLSRGSVF